MILKWKPNEHWLNLVIVQVISIDP